MTDRTAAERMARKRERDRAAGIQPNLLQRIRGPSWSDVEREIAVMWVDLRRELAGDWREAA